MDDLIAFVTARLDEDEAAAKAAWGVEWDWRYVAQPFGERPSIAHTVHIARHDPARALREVAAKRVRLAYYEHAQAKLDHVVAHPAEMSPGDEGVWLGKAAAARMACRCDAAIWSDHPGYRPEWKP